MPGDSTSARTPPRSPAFKSVVAIAAASPAARLVAASAHAITRAPPRFSASAGSRPARARPSPALRSLRKEVMSIIARSPELQRGETGDRQDRGDDPEADDDGGLLPALLFEVMVERRHAEDALAGEPEARHLDDDRDRFQHEEAADD